MNRSSCHNFLDRPFRFVADNKYALLAMIPNVKKLLAEMRDSEEIRQNRAVAKLHALLEQSMHAEREEPVWALVLPSDLLGIRLTPEEISEVLEEMVRALKLDELRRSTKLSLAQVLALNADLRHAGPLLDYFRNFSPLFDEQEAYGFLGCFTQFLRRVGELDQLQSYLENYDTIRSLRFLSKYDSESLNESIIGILRMLKAASGENVTNEVK